MKSSSIVGRVGFCGQIDCRMPIGLSQPARTVYGLIQSTILKQAGGASVGQTVQVDGLTPQNCPAA